MRDGSFVENSHSQCTASPISTSAVDCFGLSSSMIEMRPATYSALQSCHIFFGGGPQVLADCHYMSSPWLSSPKRKLEDARSTNVSHYLHRTTTVSTTTTSTKTTTITSTATVSGGPLPPVRYRPSRPDVSEGFPNDQLTISTLVLFRSRQLRRYGDPKWSYGPDHLFAILLKRCYYADYCQFRGTM